MFNKNVDVTQANVIWHQDFERLVQELYGLKYHTQALVETYETFVDEENINGFPDPMFPEFYSINMDKEDLSNYSQEEKIDDSEVLNYWKNHASNTEKPFYEVDDNGEYRVWQPSLRFVLNGLYNAGKIPAGDYIITIAF